MSPGRRGGRCHRVAASQIRKKNLEMHDVEKYPTVITPSCRLALEHHDTEINTAILAFNGTKRYPNNFNKAL